MQETLPVNGGPLTISDVVKRTKLLFGASVSIVQIRTKEPYRIADALRQEHVGKAECTYLEYDVLRGFMERNRDNVNKWLVPPGDKIKGDTNLGTAKITPAVAFRKPIEKLIEKTDPIHVMPGKEQTHVITYINPQFFLADPLVRETLQQYATYLPGTNLRVILITADETLPLIPGTAVIVNAGTPDHNELVRRFNILLKNYVDECELRHDCDVVAVDMISKMGAGMTVGEFETHVSVALHRAVLDAPEGVAPVITANAVLASVSAGKIEIVKESDILELYPSAAMTDVGGLQNLKNWISNRKRSFTPEAAAFGMKPPKGVMVVGVPGSGKSLIAKAISTTLNMPLMRLDFGRVYGSLVGDSERRMREALAMVEAMAPVVLFADEIDKGLGGSGDRDGGVSTRVLGTFLTWMQENTSQVFVVMTANRTEGLPPELMRKGRVDAIFATGLPSWTERKDVLEIHLRKRDRDIEELDANKVVEFLNATHGFVQSEIEACVVDALVLAFNEEDAEDITADHLLAAAAATVAQSVSHKDRIDAILAWSKANALPASINEDVEQAAQAAAVTIDSARRVSPRRVTRGAGR